MRDPREGWPRFAFAALVLLFCAACSSSDGGAAAGQGGQSGVASGGSGVGGGSSSGGVPGTGSAGGTANGGTSGNGGAGATTSATDALWKGFAEALCHHYVSCPGETYKGDVIAALTDAAGCTAALEKHLRGNTHYAALNAGVAAGKLAVDSSNPAACFAAARACTYPIDKLPTQELTYEDIGPCREIFEGKTPLGGSCNVSEECAGDAFCAVAQGGSCVGTCQTRSAIGATCSISRQCGGPSRSSWSTCHDGKCDVVQLAAPTAGGQCGFVTATDFKPCSEGSFCPNVAFGASTCQTPKAAGAACDFTAGDQCAGGICSENTCKAWHVNQIGGTCGLEQVCDTFADAVCNGVTRKCAQANGSVCEVGTWFLVDQCAPSSPPKPVGGTCTTGAQCASGLCDPNTGCVSGLCSG